MGSELNSDVLKRLVIARVGWCTRYDGDAEDLPRDGGSFNKDDVGSEHHNFLPFEGRYYGYARISHGGLLNLIRVAGATLSIVDAGSDDEHVSDVCVALIAKNGAFGQVLVGWYRHAMLFASLQQHESRGYFNWSCKKSDGVLLAPEDRTLIIPKGKGATGQSAFTYSRDLQGERYRDRPFITQIRKFISSYTGKSGQYAGSATTADSIVRGQGFQWDVRFRQEIERHSMRVVERQLKKRYAIVKDVSKELSFDFLCTSGNGKQRKVEVKGTTTAGDSVLVSRREYDLARREHVDLYVVRGINIDVDAGVALATGGEISVFADWGNGEINAKPVGYDIKLSR